MVRRGAADRGATSPTPTTGSSTVAGGRQPGRTYLTSVDDGHGSRRHHRRPGDSTSRTPSCRCCRSRSSPSTSGRTSRRTRSSPTATSRPTASRSSVPARSGSSRAPRAARRTGSEANPDYWGGAPHVDQVVFRVFKSEDPAVQALHQGRGRLRRRHHPAPGQGARRASDGITAQNGISPSFEEIGFNAGSVDTRRGEPIGDAQPGACWTRPSGTRWATRVDNDRIVESAYQGAADPGDHDHPRRLRRPSTGSRPTTRRSPSTSTRPASCWTRRATSSAPTGKRHLPDGSPIGDPAALRAGRGEAVGRHHGRTSRSGSASWASTPRSARWRATS